MKTITGKGKKNQKMLILCQPASLLLHPVGFYYSIIQDRYRV